MSHINFKISKASSVLVSNTFIEKYMPKANGSFVKVYLYGLMCCTQNLTDVTNKTIAEALDMLESDVHNAWKYWEKSGVIRFDASSDLSTIEFLDFNQTVEQKIFEHTQSKPTYHPKELDIYINNNSEISHLFKTAQKMLGKPLSPSDSNTLFSFYDWLRLPVEVIVMLLEYCVSNDKLSMRYIEKVAISWAEKGIDSTDKVENYLKEFEIKNSNLSILKNALGISGMFTEAQLIYLNKWMYEYKFDVDIIKIACDQTILNIGKPSIKYLDSILEEWHKKNIHTKELALNDIKSHSDKNKDKSNTTQKQTTQVKTSKNNKFLNFSQDKPDFDNFMKLAREKRINDLKESRSS